MLRWLEAAASSNGSQFEPHTVSPKLDNMVQEGKGLGEGEERGGEGGGERSPGKFRDGSLLLLCGHHRWVTDPCPKSIGLSI